MTEEHIITIRYVNGELRGTHQTVDLHKTNFYPGETFTVVEGRRAYNYLLKLKPFSEGVFNAYYISDTKLEEVL